MKPSYGYDSCVSKRTKLRRISDGIRRAVDASGLSRYAICKACGIDQGSFSRFMAGKVGMTMANLDAVAAVLGLRIVARGRVRKGTAGRSGLAAHKRKAR